MSERIKENGHEIWSNFDLNLDDWREDLIENLEANGYKRSEITEDMLWDEMFETNASYLDDARLNLDIQLDKPILVVGDLGLWDGCVSAYRDIDSGNIADCFTYQGDYARFYLDERGDFCADDYHHDGVNHYTYREIKDGVSEEQVENLKLKLYNGTATRRDVTRVTRRLGDDIAKVYGWKIPRQRESKSAEER